MVSAWRPPLEGERVRLDDLGTQSTPTQASGEDNLPATLAQDVDDAEASHGALSNIESTRLL